VRIGIFGGTFDPPHIGHLIVAQDAMVALRLDAVRFIPAALPPHKRNTIDISPAALRLEMVREATSTDPRYSVDPLEIERGGASYTVDTLRALRERLPDAELVLLIGADQYAEFREWREPDEIVSLARVGVLARARARIEVPAGARSAEESGRIHHVAVTRIDVSSTEIRRRVRSGEPIRYLVPQRVEAVIRREGLYLTP
jgi:nicotinate-nucleotide adenylyltransferase